MRQSEGIYSELKRHLMRSDLLSANVAHDDFGLIGQYANRKKLLPSKGLSHAVQSHLTRASLQRTYSQSITSYRPIITFSLEAICSTSIVLSRVRTCQHVVTIIASYLRTKKSLEAIGSLYLLLLHTEFNSILIGSSLPMRVRGITITMQNDTVTIRRQYR